MEFARLPIVIATAFTLVTQAAHASEALTDSAIVSQKVVYPGQTVLPDILKPVRLREKMPLSSGYVFEIEDIVGKVASSTLLPNRLIRLSQLTEAPIVKSGDQVKIVYEAPGLTIFVQGMALSAGAAGEAVSVRNTSTGKQVFGVIVDTHSVRVLPR